jgi:diguanylate cyclase (GGDEF)-like protein
MAAAAQPVHASVVVFNDIAAVLLYLLIVAAVNLAVGYCLAVLLGSSRSKNEQAVAATQARVAHPAASIDAVPAPKPSAAPSPLAVDQIPTHWRGALEEAGEVRSFLEASVQIMRLEVGRYRDRLITIDGMLRKCLREPRYEPLITCVGELQEANEDWLRTQAEAMATLQAKGSQLGETAVMSASLGEILREQASQIETTSGNIELLDLQSDPKLAAARMIAEVCNLLDLAHRLRDRMLESLVSILHHDRRLMALDPERLMDAATGVYNRLGMERMLEGWWANDPARARQASFALVDVDRLGRINEEHGPLVGDRAINHLGRLVSEALRHNRGSDVAGRLGGQTFALFFGDTAPQNVVTALERIRQTMGANQFLSGQQEVPLHVTCGIIEVGAHDTSTTLCQRAMQTLRDAKRAGRDLTLWDGGSGAVVVEPPPCEVTADTVRLDRDLSPVG